MKLAEEIQTKLGNEGSGILWRLGLVRPFEAKVRAVKYIRDGDRILDIGSGNGNFFDIVANKRKKVIFFGVEINPYFIGLCKEKGYTVVSDLADITGSFDVITMFDVIEHLDDEAIIFYFKRIKELLRKNGYLIIATPNIKCYYVLMSFWDNVGHKRPYSLETLEMLSKDGFQIIEVFNFSRIINPLKLLRCILLGSSIHYNTCFVLRS